MRVRGDNNPGTGSPPHMRGKGLGIQSSGQVAGITPAHAGKSSDQRQRLRLRWDHPRTCGEKCSSEEYVSIRTGSPPHMRGKDVHIEVDIAPHGITPAHAGKSPVARPAPGAVRGSPPHMRGKGQTLQWMIFRNGITPAHAGKRLRKP